MKKLLKLSIYGLLAGDLAACNNNPVEVRFAQPFPVNGADEVGFKARDQGHYVAADDTARALLISQQSIVSQVVVTVKMRAAGLDSLGLPRRAGTARGRDGGLYQVLALTADSCRLRWAQRDTLVQLHGPNAMRLRRYRGWYYLSAPTGTGTWEVERLTVAANHLLWQEFNGDSLRIRALMPNAVQLKRAERRLLFTLTPSSGQSIRQVNSYNGLWLPKGDYLRKP